MWVIIYKVFSSQQRDKDFTDFCCINKLELYAQIPMIYLYVKGEIEICWKTVNGIR